MSEFFIGANLKLRYDPFPIGNLAPMVDAALYAEMLDNWPATDLFEFMPRLGNKYSLSETCHAAQYHAFVRGSPIWTRFDHWIRGPGFVPEVMEALLANYVDLGYRPGISWSKQTLKNIKAALRGRSSNRGARLQATWEFQMMPGDSGHILPHTDAPGKVVTLTLAIVREGEWKQEWGGGLNINRPRDVKYVYNQLNQQADFEDMEIVDTIEFAPNTGVVFVKTFNSWHSVQPMRATGPGHMRRNLVINIRSD